MKEIVKQNLHAKLTRELTCTAFANHAVANGGSSTTTGVSSTGIAIFSPAPSGPTKVQTKSIAEITTHSQANQSPNRVYIVLSVRKSYGKFAAARTSGGKGR